MTTPTPTDEELIALLKDKLPHELSEEEVKDLRAALETTPAVRDSLIELLHIDQGISSHYAPELQDLDSILLRLDNPPRSSKTLRLPRALGLLVLGLCIVCGAVAVWYWSTPNQTDSPQEKSIAANKDTQSKIADADTKKQNGQPSKPPTSLDNKSKPDDNAGFVPPKIRMEPAWRVFDQGPDPKSIVWRESLHKTLMPIGGARLFPGPRDEGLILQGAFAVATPTDDGRAVRLRMNQFSQLRWSFWRGNEGTLVEWHQDGESLRAFKVRRNEQRLINPLLEKTDDQATSRDRMVEHNDSQIDFSWNNESPADDGGNEFSAKWRGYITVPEGGQWTVFATTPGSVVIRADDSQIIHHVPSDSKQEPVTLTGRLWAPLDNPEQKNPRTFAIEIDYGDVAAGSITLEWEREKRKPQRGKVTKWDRPLIPRHVVPATAFHTVDQAGKQEPGLAATYLPGPASDVLGNYEVLNLVADDHGRWSRQHFKGPVDIRYEGGAVHITRGENTLLSLPMEAPPEQFIMETRGHLTHAETFYLPDLGSKLARGPFTDNVENRLPADFDWKSTPDSDVRLTKKPEHEVEFHRNQAGADWQALAAVPRAAGCEVTMRIEHADPGTGVVALPPTSGRSAMRFFVGIHDGKRVFCTQPEDKANRNTFADKGWFLADRFWVRFTLSVNDLRLAFSNDGTNWIQVQQHLFQRNRSLDTHFQFGVGGTEGEGQQQVTVAAVAIRRLRGIEGLVNAATFKSALNELGDTHGPSADWAQVYDALVASRPDDIHAREWERGCRLAMIHAPTPSPLRQEHAIDLVRTSLMDSDFEWKHLKAALLELPRRINLSDPSVSWATLGKLYEGIAVEWWADSKLRQRIPDLMDAWYHQDLGILRLAEGQPLFPSPTGLTRMGMFALSNSGNSQRLWSAALRDEFLSTRSNGTPLQYRGTRIDRLTTWMQAQSIHNPNGTFGEAVVPDDARSVQFYERRGTLPQYSSTNPLATGTRSRELAILSQEIQEALEAKEWNRASSSIVREPLTNEMTSAIQQGDVQVAASVAIRQWVDEYPELALALAGQQQLGRVRLNRAIKLSDVTLLESVATQFHGTGVGNQALAILANRELSMREFLRAGTRFRQLSEAAPAQKREQWEARYRLAMAFVGKEVGKPPSAPVQFSDYSMSPTQFEAAVANALVQGQSGLMNPVLTHDRIQKTDRTYTQGQRIVVQPVSINRRRQEQFNRQSRYFPEYDPVDFGWAVESDLIFIHQPGNLKAVNLETGEVQFDVSEPAELSKWMTREMPRPLVTESSVIVPFFRTNHFDLTSIEKQTGNIIWRQSLDTSVVGEPIMANGTLFVVSMEELDSDKAVVRLRNIDPTSGRILLSRELLRVQINDSVRRVGRPQILGNRLFVRMGGGLICSDLFGNLRWMRQMPYVPAEVEPEQYAARILSDLILVDGAVVVASPGSWNIECRDLETGAKRWIFAEPRICRVVGECKGRVILAVTDGIQALDSKTGNVAWRYPWVGDPRGILLTDEGLVLVPTDVKGQEGMLIQALDAENGKLRNKLEMNASVSSGTHRATTDGNRLFMIRRKGRQRGAAIEIELWNPTK